MIRNVLRTVALTGLIAAGSLTAASPASAHESCDYLSSSRGYGCVASAHHWAWVCDTKPDNVGVRIYVKDNRGYWYSASDTNGSQSGCGGIHTGSHPDGSDQTWVQYQVCNANDACNPVRNS